MQLETFSSTTLENIASNQKCSSSESVLVERARRATFLCSYSVSGPRLLSTCLQCDSRKTSRARTAASALQSRLLYSNECVISRYSISTSLVAGLRVWHVPARVLEWEWCALRACASASAHSLGVTALFCITTLLIHYYYTTCALPQRHLSHLHV